MSLSITQQNHALSMMGVEAQRELGEIQAKIFLARQFPRDVTVCIDNIITACKDPKLAEAAQYSFERGGSEVKGASIRLLEVIGQHWGNLLTGVKEISRSDTGATAKSFAWDLETNVADEKIFDTTFIRNTKRGSYQVTDERDRYEMVANNGARRKRACMQAVIPAYVIDAAVAQCDSTLKASITKDKPIEQVREDSLRAFQDMVDWVTADMLAEYVNKDFDKIGNQDLVKLKKLYTAIRDGFAKPEDIFKRETDPPSDEDDAAAALTGVVTGK